MLCLFAALMMRVASWSSPILEPRVKGTARVNGAALYYEIFGRGPTLVFLHAGLADSRMWDREVEYFSGKYSVLRFDARGYGKSDVPVEPYTPVDDLHGLLGFLGIERACVIGLSMGGTVAIDFAAAYPEAISCLVVVAGTPGWQSYSDALVHRVGTILEMGQQKGQSAVVDGWLNDPMLAAAKAKPRIAKQLKTFLTQNARGFLSTPLMRPPNIDTPNLRNLKVPTLVVVGNRDDPEIVERSRTMTREIPGARQAVINGAGHIVNLEKPQEFDRILAQFISLQSLR